MSISEFLRKTFARQESRVHQAGQAVVEYILILVLTVAIILGAMSQFSDAFKQFLDSYFGDYIACLLETGELPAFGGSGISSGECNARFQNFSMSNGRPRVQSTNGGGSGSSSSSGSGSSSDSSSGDSDSSSSSSGKNKALRPASFSNGGGVGNADASSLSNRLRPGTQGLKNNGKNASSSAAGSDSDSTDGGFGGSRKRGRRYRTRIITLGDEYVTEDAKKKSKKTVSRSVKTKEQKAKEDLRAAQFELVVPEKRKVASEEETKGFSFGSILKFLLIAGILVAIFIFLGGQAMQIKKSWQKTE